MTSKGRAEDTYRLVFPKEASEQERVLLVGATFLVDYTLFDQPAEADHDSRKPGEQAME
jgi:acyl-CoA-binding protein